MSEASDRTRVIGRALFLASHDGGEFWEDVWETLRPVVKQEWIARVATFDRYSGAADLVDRVAELDTEVDRLSSELTHLE